MIKTRTYQIINQATINQSIRKHNSPYAAPGWAGHPFDLHQSRCSGASSEPECRSVSSPSQPVSPLVLLAGAWSTAPFYKNFILTFSGIVNYTDITKFDSILFGPFSENCHTASTAGYQSILISDVCLQRDTTGKLASPKMLFDELCCNPVFVGCLPLAAPHWLFNPDKLLTSGKLASSITFAFHDPTGEGLKLMKHSCIGMFGKLVTI